MLSKTTIALRLKFNLESLLEARPCFSRRFQTPSRDGKGRGPRGGNLLRQGRGDDPVCPPSHLPLMGL